MASTKVAFLGLLGALVAVAWFIPLLQLVLMVVAGLVSAIFGATLTLVVLARKNAWVPLRRTLKPLALVYHWDKVVQWRRSESIGVPHKPLVESTLVQERFDKMIRFIQRDFVNTWYADISHEDLFQRKVDAHLRFMFKELVVRLGRVDPVHLVVRKIIPILTDHIHRYRAAVTQVHRKYVGAFGDAEVTESEEMDKLIVQHYRKGKLHRALLSKVGSSDSEVDYLRRVVDLILPTLCQGKEYKSTLFRLLVREILAGKVIHPALVTFADPDYINQLLNDYAEGELTLRGKAQKLRETLDEFFTGASSEKETTEAALSRVLSFDEFLKVIRECNTVLDAKRIRHQIVTEIKKKAQHIRGRRPEDVLPGGIRVQDLQRYINRLNIARKRAEARIEQLGGRRFTVFGSKEAELEEPTAESEFKITLATMFKSNIALFYFMEFMERNQGMKLLQFLLTIESFKKLLGSASTEDAKMIVEDAKHIHATYLAADAPERLTAVSAKAAADVNKFINGAVGHSQDSDSVLRVQREIFDLVDRDFYSKFVQSDLFFRFTADPAAKSELAALEEESLLEEKPIPAPPPPQQQLSTSPTSQSLLSPSSGIVTSPSIGSTLNDDGFDTASKFPDTSKAESDTVAAVESALDKIVNNTSIDMMPSMEGSALLPQRDATVYDRVDLVDEEDLDLAPPSEALLSHSIIDDINEQLDKLVHQKDVLDAIILKTSKKTDKVAMANELKILNISKQRVQEDIRNLQLKKIKYEGHEDKNVIMPGIWTVHISSSTIGYENGKPFALYLIEVHRQDPQNPSGWVVARRYREFFDLHEKLRRQFPIMRELELPGKHMMNLFRLKKEFVEERRVQLKHYLQRLLDQNEICRSKELREFLAHREQIAGDKQDSSGRSEFGDITAGPKSADDVDAGIMQNILGVSKIAVDTLVKPFSDVLDDIFSGPPAQADAATRAMDKARASTPLQNSIQQQLQQQSLSSTTSAMAVDQDELYDSDGEDTGAGSHAAAMPRATGPQQPPPQQPQTTTSLAEPLCALMIEMFEMKERSSYLRRQAVLLILQQILGGTIERKVAEDINWYGKEEQLVFYFDRFITSMWPNDVLGPPAPTRSLEQRDITKREARAKLLLLLTELFSGMVGSENTRRGGIRFFEAFQSTRLNKHLLFTIFDEVIGALFPEIGRLAPADTGSHARPTSIYI